MSISQLAALVVVLWIFIYTMSYGVWNWNNKNKFAACMIFVVALTSVALPVYMLFFRAG